MRNALAALLLSSLSLNAAAKSDPAKAEDRLKKAAVIASLTTQECKSILATKTDARTYRAQVKGLVPYIDALRSQEQLVLWQLGGLDPQAAAGLTNSAAAWRDTSKDAILCLDAMTEDGQRPMNPGDADPRFSDTYGHLVDRALAAYEAAGKVYGMDFVMPAGQEVMSHLLKP